MSTVTLNDKLAELEEREDLEHTHHRYRHENRTTYSRNDRSSGFSYPHLGLPFTRGLCHKKETVPECPKDDTTASGY